MNTWIRRIVLGLGVLGGSLYAQQPTVSGITVDALDTSSFRMIYTVSGVPGAWAEVFYGTQSGSYPYNTKSISCYNRTDPCQTGGGVTALTVTGLKPGTTYYVRATARPHPDDDLDICNTAGCGSEEQVITTLSGPQPMPPVTPSVWAPTLPDTTGYAVIPLEVGETGECRAAQTVTTSSGTVTAGTYLGAMLPVVGYGTIFELPQGAACKVPQGASGHPGMGYQLRSKPLDTACGGVCGMTDSRHRWIIFRTKQEGAADFPPFGSRITPDFAPQLGKFYSSQRNGFSQLFDANNSDNATHHIWFQNVEFMADPAYQNPTDVVDPLAFNYFVRMGSQFQIQNNQFLVFDRVYAHGPGAPIRQEAGYELSGNNIAMVGCYTAQIETWRMTEWPSVAGTLSGGNTILNMPKNNYRFSKSSPQLGMSAAATALLSNATADGVVIGNLYKDHVEIQYTAGAATISCTGCTAIATGSPQTPPTAMPLFSGTFSSSGFQNVYWNTQEWMTSRYAMAYGVSTSDLKAAGGPYYFDNNYVDGIGEGFYMDPAYSEFSNDDIIYTHNHHIWPKTAFVNDPGNQWRYEVRQHWESKRVHRAVLRGNLFSYSWSFQTSGPAIFLSSRPTYVVQASNDGISDVLVESNIISHGRNGVECMGGNPMGNNSIAAEPRAAKRVQIVNNLMFDLGRWKYCDNIGCPGLGAQYFSIAPGCQDMVIENNTGGITYGEIPSILYLGGGHQLGNFLSFRKNVLYFSKGTSGAGGGSIVDWAPNFVANHTIKPAPVFENSGEAPNFKLNLDSMFVNAAATVTPSYSWGQNVMIGGWRDTNQTLAGAVDMSYSELRAYAARMPAGDIYPTGNTISARESQLKLASPAAFDYRITGSSSSTPGGLGVDFERLYKDQGRVIAIDPPQVSSVASKFAYTAPDGRACAVDVGLAGVWTRTMDSGGARRRSLTVTGLQEDRTYQYRILCYYKQVNDGILYTDYTKDQITNGTFRTLFPQQTLAEVPFVLSEVENATQVKVTLSPVVGAQATQVCSTSPCRMQVENGDYAFKVQYLDAGNAELSSGTGKLSIR